MTFYMFAFSDGSVIGFESTASAELYASMVGVAVTYASPLSNFAVTVTVAA